MHDLLFEVLLHSPYLLNKSIKLTAVKKKTLGTLVPNTSVTMGPVGYVLDSTFT